MAKIRRCYCTDRNNLGVVGSLSNDHPSPKRIPDISSQMIYVARTSSGSIQVFSEDDILLPIQNRVSAFKRIRSGEVEKVAGKDAVDLLLKNVLTHPVSPSIQGEVVAFVVDLCAQRSLHIDPSVIANETPMKMFEALLNGGLDPDVRFESDGPFSTMLQAACDEYASDRPTELKREFILKRIQILIKHGANPLAPSKDGRTALQILIRVGNISELISLAVSALSHNDLARYLSDESLLNEDLKVANRNGVPDFTRRANVMRFQNALANEFMERLKVEKISESDLKLFAGSFMPEVCTAVATKRIVGTLADTVEEAPVERQRSRMPQGGL